MRVRPLVVAAVIGSGLLAPASRALDFAQDAADHSAYSDGWQNEDDGGSGWDGGWEFFRLGAEIDVGYAIESSTQNGIGDPDGDGDIDTNGLAWKLWARNGASVGAARHFAVPMKSGDTFAIDMDVADLPLDVFAIVDFETATSATPRMSFGLRDGAATYRYYDKEGDTDSGVVVNESGLHLEFTVTGANTYSMRLVPRIGSEATHAGILYGSGPITTVGIYLATDATPLTRRAFFNSALLVPEPGATSAVAAMALAALAYRRRVPRIR